MMATKAGKRPLRSLTAHEKLEAIRRVHDGESKASVARDIGVPESTLRGWCKNEEKISYISRQSSPETDDSIHMSPYEPKEKKIKLTDVDAPFNLSLKSNALDDNKPLNLKSSDSPKMSERERNRAELARLSIELGLNRPEMYPTTGNTLADLTSNIGLLSQWNNLLLQTQKKVTAADSSSNKITSSTNNLLTTTTNVFPKDNNKTTTSSLDLSSKVDPQKSVEESVWYWLKTQQAMLGLAAQNPQTMNMPSSTSGSVVPPPTSIASDQSNSWFWNWYKQYTQTQLQLQQQQQQQQQQQHQKHQQSSMQVSPQPHQQQQQQPQQQPQQILYQQLTKDSLAKETDSENMNKSDGGEKPQATNKARAVLDNLLLNNNNVPANCNGAKDDDLSQMEALEHGEKFLKWLECCSEPSVSAMQIMQFRGLINNIKSGVDRKNGDVMQKTKVRRK